MISCKRLSGLHKLTKDEVGKVELTDEMMDVIKKVMRINVTVKLIEIITCLSILSFLSLVLIIKNSNEYILFDSYSSSNLIIFIILFGIITIPLIIYNLISIVNFRLSKIKYSGFYQIYKHPKEKQFSLFEKNIIAIDKDCNKILPKSITNEIVVFNVEYGLTYLFVSCNGITYHLIPVRKELCVDVDEELMQFYGFDFKHPRFNDRIEDRMSLENLIIYNSEDGLH